MVAFLPSSLLELAPEKRSDDDILLQAALYMEKLYEIWRRLNIPKTRTMRSHSDIEKIMRAGYLANVMLAFVVSIPISTKLHRIMHHPGEALRKFGCIMSDDCDANESVHRCTKSFYANTNRRIEFLSGQVLKTRTSNEDEVSTMIGATNSILKDVTYSLELANSLREDLRTIIFQRELEGMNALIGSVRVDELVQ